ncbi:uncharacterized protein A4U43_C05F7580 [Asparagus officinalis]|uniref:Uncharacterized protein n=1 Tax=Asparagus officinalis TaxID=4686 RepID=A0A5P1ER27_ASPOF|nr:uncharacterized protein A4U43_C05F7580 [Asparagus officinalis]
MPVYRFHVGFGFGASNGFVMHEFQEFLGRLMGGVVRAVNVRVGSKGEWARRFRWIEGGVHELFVCGYSYIEGEDADRLVTGETCDPVLPSRVGEDGRRCRRRGRARTRGEGRDDDGTAMPKEDDDETSRRMTGRRGAKGVRGRQRPDDDVEGGRRGAEGEATTKRRGGRRDEYVEEDDGRARDRGGTTGRRFWPSNRGEEWEGAENLGI